MAQRRWIAAALLALMAVPAAAQMGYSEAFTFHKAVRERDAAVVNEMSANPASNAINAPDSGTGERALHILVRGRDLNWLNFLLARGARPDLAGNDGTTPLLLAAQMGWYDGAEALLRAGAGVDVTNRRGETPLILAVQRRDLQLVRLLLSRGASPSHTDNVAGYSALDYARQDRRPTSAAILRALEEGPQRQRPAVGPSLDP